MNILLVVTGLPDKKSPARSVFNLRYAEELMKLGHKVTILYLRAIRPGRPFLHISNANGIDVFEFSILIPKVSFIKNTTPIINLFNYLLRKEVVKNRLQEIDIVHAIHRGSVEMSYLVCKRFNKPMISQFIGGDLSSDISHLLKRNYFIKGLKQSNYLCFNSKRLEDDFLFKINDNYKTEVLYRGVKLDDFPYNFIESSTINILFLGGFPGNTNLKGGLTLIDSIKLLDETSISNPVKFTIGGPNSFNFNNSLDALNNRNIIIDFIGAVDKDLVRNKMIESHIVIIPSLAEGLPNVLYEAMASGNMVIATNVGGIPEILEGGKTGILVQPNNPKALMNAIIDSIERFESIEGFAKNGRKRIENLSYDRFVNGYLELYSESIENHNA